MQVKHLAFYILLVIGVSACNSSKENGFTVQGKIANMPDQTVYLEELNINDIVLVDSAVSQKGGFKVSGVSPEPSLYRLRFNDDKYLLLSINEGEVKVNADWNSFENYSVEGSASSRSLKDFLTVVRQHLGDFRTMAMVIDTLQARNDDSMLAVAQKDLMDMNMSFTRYIENYADTTSSLPNAVFAAQMLNPQVEKDFLDVFVQNLNARFKEAKLAKDFTNRYAQMMALQNQQQMAASGPAIGTQAPDLVLTSPEGNEISLTSLKGKYILLDFWASWCQPCRRENPNVVAAFNKYKNKNFTVFGVSLDNNKEKWLEAIEKDQLTWPHASDLEGWESMAARSYGIESIPSNFLIDPNGKIIARDLRGAALEAKLAEVLQ